MGEVGRGSPIMIKYKLVKNTNEKSDYVDMYSARAAYDGMIDLEALVKHMASHNSPFSEGTINGVLKDMISCIRELLLESKKVKLDGLAIFSLGLKSTYATSPKLFTVRDNIKGAHINARGTGEFAKKQLDIDCRFTEADEYQVK